jgi:hypothetical protein
MTRLQKEFLRDRLPGLRNAKIRGHETYIVMQGLLYAQWFDIWPEPQCKPGADYPDPEFHDQCIRKTKAVSYLFTHPSSK